MIPDINIYNNIALLNPHNAYDLESLNFYFMKSLKNEQISSVAIDENNVLIGVLSGSA